VLQVGQDVLAGGHGRLPAPLPEEGQVALGPAQRFARYGYPRLPHAVEGPPLGLVLLDVAGFAPGPGPWGRLGRPWPHVGQRRPELGGIVAPDVPQGDVGALVEKDMEGPAGDRPRHRDLLRAVCPARQGLPDADHPHGRGRVRQRRAGAGLAHPGLRRPEWSSHIRKASMPFHRMPFASTSTRNSVTVISRRLGMSYALDSTTLR